MTVIVKKRKAGPVTRFVQHNYRHFNAATLRDAADAWIKHLDKGGQMMLAMAGAMSSGELGISLAEMIRRGKIHAISTTGANMEEDLYNLVAHNAYVRLPSYRDLTPQAEKKLYRSGHNRVTDTCIPEEEAMRKLERHMVDVWRRAEREGRRHHYYEYFYQVIRGGALKKYYQIDPKHSWLIAACEKNLPVYTPGCEDSTLGNNFVSHIHKGTISDFGIIKSGMEQMDSLIKWHKATSKKSSIGFFQIGGGIAGDFPICVVPLIIHDLKQPCKFWGYFCQISDSTTSYGSYSGAVPNEKITWGKLDIHTPKFIIESDASIVAPLIFEYVLGR